MVRGEARGKGKGEATANDLKEGEHGLPSGSIYDTAIKWLTLNYVGTCGRGEVTTSSIDAQLRYENS